ASTSNDQTQPRVPAASTFVSSLGRARAERGAYSGFARQLLPLPRPVVDLHGFVTRSYGRRYLSHDTESRARTPKLPAPPPAHARFPHVEPFGGHKGDAAQIDCAPRPIELRPLSVLLCSVSRAASPFCVRPLSVSFLCPFLCPPFLCHSV